MSSRQSTGCHSTSRFSRFLVVALLSLSVLSTRAQAQANSNPGVVPIHANYAGKSYGEWAAAWWQWAYRTFTFNSPMLDPTGENASVGQSGPVYFLAFTFAPTVVRNITVPAGKVWIELVPVDSAGGSVVFGK